jgi:hypothetical protein
MRRWHQDLSVTSRQRWLQFHFVHDGQATGCACDEQLGRFRKRRALDCGHSRCQLCHFDKIHGIKSHRQLIEDLRFHEQVHNDD